MKVCAEENGDFSQQSFLWLPSLNGPTFSEPYSLDWLHGMPENIAYFSLPTLLFVEMYINHKISMENINASDQNDDSSKEENRIDVAITRLPSQILPFFAYSLCMITPSAVSLHWLSNNLFFRLQKFVINENIKADMGDIGSEDKQIGTSENTEQ